MNNSLPLSRAFAIGRLTIGHWLGVLFAVALVSWGAAFWHNVSQIGLLGGGLVLYWAARRLGTQERQWLLKMAGWVASLGIIALTAVNGFERLPAEPINPNALASVLLLVLPVLPWLVLPALVLTQTRAAWLAAFVYYWKMVDGFVVRPMVADEPDSPRYHPTRSLIFAVLLAVVLACGLVAIRPETVVARTRIWQEALALTAQNPVWGVGFGNYAHYAHVERAKLHADSLPLTFLAEMGVVGGGAALFALGAIAYRVWQSPARPALKWGLLLWLMQQAVDHTATHVMVLAVLMIALADVEPS